MPRSHRCAAPITADALETDLERVRDRTLSLVDGLGEAELHQPLGSMMSPLVWDLGHIAAYEDLWLVHRHGARPLLRPDLAVVYDAFETPRPSRTAVELLDFAEACGFMAAVRERTLEVLAEQGPDALLHEMVLRHELQHTETMLQALRLGGVDSAALADPEPVPGAGLDLIAVPGGAFDMGAGADGFAYDNERPRHRVELPPYRIARTPVTNATWLAFSEGGGYERREWWSDEAWAWKEDHDITHCPWARTGRPDAPVCHVSCFEAEAFARAHGLRLPSEAEWERAVTSEQAVGLEGVGRVWEWTASEFAGYPAFAARPYREYSEVFFGRGYRVLRGGSTATHPRVASTTFRNWDLPKRRQLFAGVRLAGDA